MAAKKRKEGKGKSYGRSRGGPGCLSFLFLAALILAALAATIAIFFQIKHIEVIGGQRYSPEEIRTASGVEQGDNLLLFNKFGAIGSIFSRLPYISEVRMTRDLPDTLRIEIKEESAIAWIEGNGGIWLLSQNGKLLEQVSEPHAAVRIEVLGAALIKPILGHQAEFAAPNSDEPDKIRFDTMVDTLSAIVSCGIAEDVESLDISKVYNVEFRYLDRFRVKLGMPEGLEYKINYLKEEVVTRLESNQTGVIDLSELIDKEYGRFIPD